jgi:hypothetical protein
MTGSIRRGDPMGETLRAWGATLGVLFGVRIVEIKTTLELILITVTIGFTLFQWAAAVRKRRKEEDDTHE